VGIQRWGTLVPLTVAALVGGNAFLEETQDLRLVDLAQRGRSSTPTSSGPIQITSDDRFVWVANPDDNSVSVIEVGNDANVKRAEIAVGENPQNVAISPDDRFVYVSNTVSGTVSVIRANPRHPKLFRTIQVGTEPYGMALTPNGDKLYVANARSNDVSVIETKRNTVIGTIEGVGLEPRGVAITNDGDGDDLDEKVYVTQFLGVDRPGVVIGADNYKEGRVTVISTASDDVVDEVVLNPISDTGFRAAGDALARVAPGTETFQTGAFPNQLNSIVIKGNRAYLPNTGVSSNGPVLFNVNLQALLSVVDIESDTENQAQTINMNRGINFEAAGPNKIFLAVPWAIAFEHGGDEGWAVASAANLIVRVALDGSGKPTVNAPAAEGDPGSVVRVFVGQNPRGLVLNTTDSRAYVMNEVSRDVSVVDLASRQVIATVPSADLPVAGTDAAKLLIGKAVFNSSTGVSLPGLGVSLGNRLSRDGWSGCVSCHPFGLTDGVVWIFGNGPRRTLQLNGTFNPRDAEDIKLLNHSGVRDEVQDFELNIRAVSGGQGLITLADGTTPDGTVNNLGAPTTGRSEFLDALTHYVARGIRTPISPVGPGEAQEIAHGRQLFASANCQSCHGGGGWSNARRFFTPPPDPSLITAGQIVSVLRNVGTFDVNAANEVRDNATPPLGAAGYVPPSLLGIHGMAPYFHNGSALTLGEVLDRVAHRAAGTGGVDVLSNASDRAAVAAFLASIDASTEPFAISASRRGAPGLRSSEASEADVAGSGILRLDPIRPNPARDASSLTIAFALPAPGPVRVFVYDVLGRRIATLAEGFRPAGRHAVQWDGRSADGARAWPGVYFVRVEAAGAERSRAVTIAP
jgi:YVTN family beta-propeller protein